MYSNIAELESKFFNDIKIDIRLYHKVESYINYWRFKKVDLADHSAFLGSNLIGVNRIVFSDGDIDKFYKDILFMSSESINKAIKSVNDINTDFNVVSNPFYITICVLLYKVYKSKLNKKDKEKFALALGLILGYKMFSSMYNHFFKYEADPAVARATYENLNKKYLLKRYGTWEDVFEHRATDLLPIEGKFSSDIEEFTTESVSNVISGVYTRYKSMLINLYSEFLDTLKRNEKISSDSKLEKAGEDMSSTAFKETISTHSSSINYVKSIINSEADLINTDYLYLISRLNNRCPIEKLQSVLLGISQHPYSTKQEDDYIERILTASYAYLATKGITANYEKQIQRCLVYLKNYWGAGNIKDPTALEAKKMCTTIVTYFSDHKSSSYISGISVGLALYIFCLATARRE